MSRRRSQMRRIAAMGMVCVAAVFTVLAAPAPAAADGARDARVLVEKSRLALQDFLENPSMGPALQGLLRHAQGVLIYPQVLRGAFVFGASGGTGVFFARDGKSDHWRGPAFYTIGGASFGLQAGGAALEVVLVAMTHRGVAALLSTSTKLGANVGMAMGPVGVGAEAATQNLSADILSYARMQGLYAGFSMEGAVVATRSGLNNAYYGRPLTPTQILIEGEGSNPASKPLIQLLQKAAARP